MRMRFHRCTDRLLGSRTPPPDGPARAGGDDPLAIVPVTDSQHRVLVSRQFCNLPVSGRVPDPHGSVVTTRDDAVPVRTERHTVYPAGVSGERLAVGLARIRIPQPDGVVVNALDRVETRGRDAVTVRAERDA